MKKLTLSITFLLATLVAWSQTPFPDGLRLINTPDGQTTDSLLVIDPADKLVKRLHIDEVLNMVEWEDITGDQSSINVSGFNNDANYAPGTVTSVTAGTGLDGGTITQTGTISLSTATQNSLDLADTAVQPADLNDYQLLSERGQPNGYASLNASGQLPTSQLPPIAITETFVVNSQAVMLALNASQGDVAVRTDEDKNYILQQEPASTLGNWVELLSPGAPIQSVNSQTGTVQLDPSFSSGQLSITGSSSVNLDSRYYTQSQVDALIPPDQDINSVLDEGHIVMGNRILQFTGTDANFGFVERSYPGTVAGGWRREVVRMRAGSGDDLSLRLGVFGSVGDPDFAYLGGATTPETNGLSWEPTGDTGMRIGFGNSFMGNRTLNVENGLYVNDESVAIDNEVVHLAGTETITGIKSFDTGDIRPIRLLRDAASLVSFYEENGTTERGSVGFLGASNNIALINAFSGTRVQLVSTGGDDGMRYFDGTTSQEVWHKGNLNYHPSDYNDALSAAAIGNEDFLSFPPGGTYTAAVSTTNSNLPFSQVGGLISFGQGSVATRILGARDGSDNLWFSSGQVSNLYIQLASRDWVSSQGYVESVTGDGVDNGDPQNPVLTFPGASQVSYDDSATGLGTNVHDALNSLYEEGTTTLTVIGSNGGAEETLPQDWIRNGNLVTVFMQVNIADISALDGDIQIDGASLPFPPDAPTEALLTGTGFALPGSGTHMSLRIVGGSSTPRFFSNVGGGGQTALTDADFSASGIVFACTFTYKTNVL